MKTDYIPQDGFADELSVWIPAPKVIEVEKPHDDHDDEEEEEEEEGY